MPLFAGLDLGTTHTKLVVLDEAGNLLHQAKSSYSKSTTAALDPLEVRELAVNLLLDAFSVIGQRDTPLYLSVSAAMHSLMLVDEGAQPLTPLSTWADTTSLPLVTQYKKDPQIRQLVAETGTPFHPMTPFAKLWQYRLNNSVLLDRAFKCIGIKEFIWFHFTGVWETDCSMAAATGMYDPVQGSWHPVAMELTGLQPAQLPEIHPVDHIGATFLLPTNGLQVIPVLGGSDGCLAQIGSKAMLPGTASLTIGTSGAMRVVQSHFISDPDSGLFSYQLDKEHYICGGPTNNGGIVLQWWEEDVMGKKAPLGQLLDQFEKEAASVVPGCEGLVCLPYFGGERAPVWDAGASGIFAGVLFQHRQAHFKRALVEGICFIFRQLLDRIETVHGPVHRIIASGGFTQSAWWVQVMSDVLQRPVELASEDADASALGAIAIAMKAAGKLNGWTELELARGVGHQTFNPDPELSLIYNNQYQQFLRLCHFS
jgi:gluconokinase